MAAHRGLAEDLFEIGSRACYPGHGPRAMPVELLGLPDTSVTVSKSSSIIAAMPNPAALDVVGVLSGA